MAIKLDDPEVKPELKTSPRRWGDWFRQLQRRIKLALAGDDDELVLENKTDVSWRVYHDYHQLGIIDSGEQRTFKLVKHGSLRARPYVEDENTEYLVLPLNQRVHRIFIYRRQMGQSVEIYDMRVA
ncbi:MAG: hypothetical protein JO215_00480 [Ktedonobacteraceae bacterium]|nr:hypothetical protein [Ktedonobacteraceae bacterium]